MPAERAHDRYPFFMRLIHWAMAALVVALLALGLYMESIPFKAPGKFDLYPLHRALGVLAFILVLVRLGVRFRFRNEIPPLQTSIPAAQRFAAHAAQAFFYAALIVMPVAGYIASSAVPEIPGVPPVNSIWFFGLELPLAPVGKDYDTMKFFIGIHGYVGYALLAVMIAHVGGALKHRFFDRPENDVLGRMI